MKKIVLLLGLVALTTSLAQAQSNYKAESDGTYTYTGTPVDELVVDFTKWGTTDLPTPLSDDMAAAEKDGMAFVKWKIASRSCGAKGTVNALFNNDAADFGGNPRNNATTNKPRIYLPTTSRGVKKITVFGGNSNVTLGIHYKDANQKTWKWKASLPLEAGFSEVNVDLNTEGQTSLYIEYSSTPYVAITNLSLELEEKVEPEESKYELDTESGKYEYKGEPVDAINVDFTTWGLSYLPTVLSDDMVLAQKNGLGFVKWKIASRSCGEKGTVNALFNNDNADFSEGGTDVKNNNTTNKPRIYLPMTVRGIKTIKVFCGNGGSVSLGVFYKDSEQTTWKWKGSIPVESSYAEQSITLNTKGQTSVFLEYVGTKWIAFTNLDVELVEDTASGIDEQKDNILCTKEIINGQIVIIKNGVRYNAQGIQF